MIKKPSRKINEKFYGVVTYSLFIFGLIIIPFISLIPKEIRMKILHRGKTIVGGEE